MEKLQELSNQQVLPSEAGSNIIRSAAELVALHSALFAKVPKKMQYKTISSNANAMQQQATVKNPMGMLNTQQALIALSQNNISSEK
jgi:hypothetical protein